MRLFPLAVEDYTRSFVNLRVMVPRACTPTNLVRDLSSPSSADVIDIAAHPNAMRKRPLDSATDIPQQPAKRERHNDNVSGDDIDGTEPKLVQAGSILASIQSVHEYALCAWETLKAREGATEFRQTDIMSVVEEKWTELQLSEKEVAKLRRDMKRQFKKNGLFKKAERSDDLSDYYIMIDAAEVKKLLSTREAGKRGDGKRADIPSGVDDDDDVILCDAVISRNVNKVPEKWTAEAFKPVRLSSFDKSPSISFVGNPLENVVKGYKGYRMIRATSGVSEGDWYFECEILPHVKGNVRLGWSMRRSDFETPVGFDPYGFGLRDLTGEFVHRARPKPYGEKFGDGDVIGCRIVLPPLTDEQKRQIAEAEERWLKYRFISNMQGPQPPDSDIDLSPHGKVEFFKNGKSMGIPAFFTDPQPQLDKQIEEGKDQSLSENGLKDNGLRRNSRNAYLKKCMKGGVYYPSVALFEDAIVKANFGPDFKSPIPQGSRPMCDAAREAPPADEKVEKSEIPLKAPEVVGRNQEYQGDDDAVLITIPTTTLPASSKQSEEHKKLVPKLQLGTFQTNESHSLPESSSDAIQDCIEIVRRDNSNIPSTGLPTS